MPRSASLDEIKAAFHRRARQWHPDALTGQHDAARAAASGARFAAAAMAYEVLRHPTSRASYDRQLAEEERYGATGGSAFDAAEAAATERGGHHGSSRDNDGAGGGNAGTGRDVIDLDSLQERAAARGGWWAELHAAMRTAHSGPAFKGSAKDFPYAFELECRNDPAASRDVLHLVVGRQWLGRVRAHGLQALEGGAEGGADELPMHGAGSATRLWDRADASYLQRAVAAPGSSHDMAPAAARGADEDAAQPFAARWVAELRHSLHSQHEEQHSGATSPTSPHIVGAYNELRLDYLSETIGCAQRVARTEEDGGDVTMVLEPSPSRAPLAFILPARRTGPATTWSVVSPLLAARGTRRRRRERDEGGGGADFEGAAPAFLRRAAARAAAEAAPPQRRRAPRGVGDDERHEWDVSAGDEVLMDDYAGPAAPGKRIAGVRRTHFTSKDGTSTTFRHARGQSVDADEAGEAGDAALLDFAQREHATHTIVSFKTPAVGVTHFRWMRNWDGRCEARVTRTVLPDPSWWLWRPRDANHCRVQYYVEIARRTTTVSCATTL